MSRLTQEQRNQRDAQWRADNEKTLKLHRLLTQIVQAVDPKFPEFEASGYTYVAPYNDKPIPSVSFQPPRGTRTIGISGSDSDLDGRFYIHAYASPRDEVYIFENARSKNSGIGRPTPEQAHALKSLKCLSLEQERELKVLLTEVVAEQKVRERQRAA